MVTLSLEVSVRLIENLEGFSVCPSEGAVCFEVLRFDIRMKDTVSSFARSPFMEEN